MSNSSKSNKLKYWFSFNAGNLFKIIQQILVVSLLNISDYGQFSYEFAYFTIFNLAYLGVIGDFSNKETFIKLKYNFHIIIRDLFYALFFICALLICFSFLESIKYSYFLILIFPFNFGYSYCKYHLINHSNLLMRAKFEINTSLISFFLCIILVYFNGIYGYVTYHILNTLIQNIYIHFILKLNPFIYGFNFENLKLYSKSFPKSLIKNLSQNLYANIDIILSGILFSSYDRIAIYKISKSTFNLLNSIYYPLIQIRIQEINKSIFSKDFLKKIEFDKSILYIIIINVIVFFVFLTKGEQIFNLIYGYNYSLSNKYFLYLIGCGGGVYFVFNFLINHIYTIKEKFNLLIYFKIISTLSFITLGFITKDVAFSYGFSMLFTSIIIYVSLKFRFLK